MINYEIENELRPYLGSDERLIWCGSPRKGIVFRNADLYLIPFSLLWGGFAIFWETTVIATKAPFFFRLWGIPFVVVGLYLIFGRFFYDARRRAGTRYGITSDRIIIKSGVFRSSVKSINIRTLSAISFTRLSDGRGTIILGPQDSRYSAFQGMNWSGSGQTPMLELIEDVKTVYDKIIQLQRQG